jgi:quercetin dioxygenase-like cupin family protein
MEFVDLKGQLAKEIIPGYKACYVHTGNLTVQYCTIKAGAPMPEHAHPHEQISTLVHGRFEMVVEGRTVLLEEGGVLVIPPNARHSGMPLTDCYIIDVFHPRREDFLAR